MFRLSRSRTGLSRPSLPAATPASAAVCFRNHQQSRLSECMMSSRDPEFSVRVCLGLNILVTQLYSVSDNPPDEPDQSRAIASRSAGEIPAMICTMVVVFFLFALGKTAHLLDQIFIALAGQPRRRHALRLPGATEVGVMTSLAYSHSAGYRGSGCAGGPCRPVFRDISRRGLNVVCLREGFCHPRHDLDVAVSLLEVLQLLEEINFILTPDDGNVPAFGCAIVAVAHIANQQFGAEFPLRAGSGTPSAARAGAARTASAAKAPRTICVRMNSLPRLRICRRTLTRRNRLARSPSAPRLSISVVRASCAIGAACFLGPKITPMFPKAGR